MKKNNIIQDRSFEFALMMMWSNKILIFSNDKRNSIKNNKMIRMLFNVGIWN